MQSTTTGASIALNYRSANLQQQLDVGLASINAQLGSGKDETIQELLFWTIRALIVLSFIILFVFLFKHEF